MTSPRSARARNDRRAVLTASLRQRILAALHFGTLLPGDRLPSVRHTGAALRADPRTVMAAYRALAAEGLVRPRPRSGIFAERPPGPAEVPLGTMGWLVDVFLLGLARGLPPTQVRRELVACLRPVRIRAACLECNNDQMHALCEQARRDYGLQVTAVDADALARGEPLPAAAAAADLVLTTRFHTSEAQRLGRRLRRPVVVATLDPAFVNEVRRMMAAGPVWWICTDPRFAAKLPGMFPGAAVHPVVLGRKLPGDIPSEAMVYATRRAAARLPPGWRGGRVISIPRVFSADTARALLTFILGRRSRLVRQSARARRTLRKRGGAAGGKARRPRLLAAGA